MEKEYKFPKDIKLNQHLNVSNVFHQSGEIIRNIFLQMKILTLQNK